MCLSNQYLLSGALNRIGYFGDFASSLFGAWVYMIVSLERSFSGFGLISWMRTLTRGQRLKDYEAAARALKSDGRQRL